MPKLENADVYILIPFTNKKPKNALRGIFRRKNIYPVPERQRDILIAPASWIAAIADIPIPAKGLMRQNMYSLGFIGDRINPSHEIIQQKNEMYNATAILKAIQEALDIQIANISRGLYNINTSESLLIPGIMPRDVVEYLNLINARNVSNS